FTDDTMLYASYSRGYKGGGANPPKPGFATLQQEIEQAQAMNIDPAQLADLLNNNELPVLDPPPGEYQPVFRPEFVNAYELGAKNTLLQGALTANANVFFYDYKDYQVSQIRDRTAVNENFDARIWGAELQAVFAPTRNLHFLGNLGYLDTRIADGMKSIDTMDRTQGHTDWVVAKPWVQYPSNCIVPVRVAEQWVKTNIVLGNFFDMCAPIGGGILGNNQSHLIDPATGEPYYARDHPEANYGAGFYADLGGNELPNAPHWTVNLGAEYRHDFGERWRATARVDAYWQSQSWARVYNAVNDKLRGWYNFNLSFWIERDDGLKIEAYAKNLFDKTPITDTFINSDDTALTTNIFVLDPRLLGVSIKKDF
ncbi:MAG: TonB-dependent receptor domain-containing protein, partial [Ignavibacteriales bacterium]